MPLLTPAYNEYRIHGIIRHWFTPASSKTMLNTVLVRQYITATRIEVFRYSSGWLSDQLAETQKHKIANQIEDFQYFA